jgi:DNA-binding NtrC family response regulator
MLQAHQVNEITTLSNSLLSNLDESVFFGHLSAHFHNIFNLHSVQVYKVYSDSSIQLMSENGEAINQAEIIEKSGSIASYVARTKRAYFSNNVQRDPLLAAQASSNIIAELCVPVISESTIIATINVRSADDAKKFSDTDINLILDVLSQVKSPINNMKLYLMAKHLNFELMKRVEEATRLTDTKSVVSKPTVKVIGHNSQFLGILDTIAKIASEDFPVLFEGNCGTGKKLLSKKLHHSSARSNNECIVLNCQLTDEEIKRELIGGISSKGILERANGGSIILSNINELSAVTQASLLKILTSGKVVLADGKELALNIRVIATSRVDLKQLVEQSKFSADLYQRVSTIKMKVPTLSERIDDIKLLASFFLNENRDESEKKVLTGKALEMLSSYNWPGNVRELKSVMERIFIMTDAKYVEAEMVPVLEQTRIQEVVEVANFEEISLQDLEKRHIVNTLDHVEGNKTKAAKLLGITVKTLYNKLHSYGVSLNA